MINSTKITKNIYQERAKILNSIPIFEITPYRTNVTNLNANCNVAHLAEQLFFNFPSLIINKKCHRCNHENLRKIPIISININILLQNGLSALRNAVLDTNYDKASICKMCHENVFEIYLSIAFTHRLHLYGWTISYFHWYREKECGTWIYTKKIKHE